MRRPHPAPPIPFPASGARSVPRPPAAWSHYHTRLLALALLDSTHDPPGSRQPAIRVSLLPRDTNPHGTIFGGVILSYIDQAGAIEARLHGADRVVTVAMEKVVFHAPVHVGDLVSFYGELVRVGRTSITVKVVVEAAPLGARAVAPTRHRGRDHLRQRGSQAERQSPSGGPPRRGG